MKIKYFLILSCSLLLAWNMMAESRIERVEPPNWWVGMQNTELQLLVYGEDISHLKPVINYDGVGIKHIISTPNPNYLFVHLDIAPSTKPGSFTIEFQEKGEAVLTHEYEVRARQPGASQMEGFNTSDVMYLITPDRFANGNPDNDVIPGMKEDQINRQEKFARHGGDIKGIRDRLDYIADLGFTAIWLNPVLENDQPDFSYHGYAATDFYQVDKRFGTNEEYRDFITACREKGIKVIMDMILNHCGSEHWFVKDPPTEDWINFGGEFVPTSHRRNTVQDIHASEYDKKRFSDGWFVRSMPDMNGRNPLMAQYLIQNTIWWIEYSGIQGIRMDTYPYPDKDFMADWTCAVLEEYPNFNVVGEEWVTNPAIVSYWQGGKQNHDGYTSCLPSLMDFPMQDALKQGLANEERRYGSGMIQFYETLALDFLYADPYELVVFPDNHDMDRFFTQVNEDFDLFKMGMVCIATLRGVPQLYYGTEILMENTGHPGDHGIIRTDFPGGWEGDAVNGFTGEGLTDQQKEAKAYVKKLLDWRKGNAVVHHGKLLQFVPQDGIYVYFRYHGDERVMVIFNKNAKDARLNTGIYREILGNSTSARNVEDGKMYELDNLSIPGKTAWILEVE